MQGSCFGQIAALASVARFLPEPITSCPPAEVTYGQVGRVIVAFLEANPNRTHEDFTYLAIEAFREAWPCKPSKGGSGRRARAKMPWPFPFPEPNVGTNINFARTRPLGRAPGSC